MSPMHAREKEISVSADGGLPDRFVEDDANTCCKIKAPNGGVRHRDRNAGSSICGEEIGRKAAGLGAEY